MQLHDQRIELARERSDALRRTRQLGERIDGRVGRVAELRGSTLEPSERLGDVEARRLGHGTRRVVLERYLQILAGTPSGARRRSPGLFELAHERGPACFERLEHARAQQRRLPCEGPLTLLRGHG